jgi:hypothetical protein
VVLAVELAVSGFWPIFSENRTGLDTGPRLNRLNRPVRSSF